MKTSLEKLQQKLLDNSLTPDKISGDYTTQEQRVQEIIHWFASLDDKNDNAELTRMNAMELAYYCSQQILEDTDPIKTQNTIVDEIIQTIHNKYPLCPIKKERLADGGGHGIGVYCIPEPLCEYIEDLILSMTSNQNFDIIPLVRSIPTTQKYYPDIFEEYLRNLKKYNSYTLHTKKLVESLTDEDLTPPNQTAFKNAFEIVNRLIEHNIMIGNVLPCFSTMTRGVAPLGEGGLSVMMKTTDKYVAFECFNDGEILNVFSEPKQEPTLEKINFDQINDNVLTTKTWLSTNQDI